MNSDCPRQIVSWIRISLLKAQLQSHPQTPLSHKEKGLVDIKHFLGLADSVVLISDVPIRMLPCDMLH